AAHLEKIGNSRGLEPSSPPARDAGAVQTSKQGAEKAAAEGASKPAASPALDFETCLEKIWEQLIATPPTRGRSMTTVKIGGARILLSSWEVTAFVSED